MPAFFSHFLGLSQSGKEVRRAFEKDGWEFVRQRGSHMILVKDGHMATLSVLDHKEVARGTLRGHVYGPYQPMPEVI